jgi:hypothetical protein
MLLLGICLNRKFGVLSADKQDAKNNAGIKKKICLRKRKDLGLFNESYISVGPAVSTETILPTCNCLMLGSVETAGYKLQTLIMVKKMAAVINV